MRTFRMAEKGDLEQCTEVFTEAFLDYDYTKIFDCKDEETRKRFYKESFHTELSIAIEKNQVLILEDDGEILSLAHLKAPEDKDFSSFEYISHGVLRAFRSGGVANALGFIKLIELTEVEYRKIEEPHWYLDGFAVKKKYHNQGIGSYMLKEGIFPYVRERGGKLFILVTNSADNEKFYLGNGLKTIKKETIHINGKEIGNWTMVIEL